MTSSSSSTNTHTHHHHQQEQRANAWKSSVAGFLGGSAGTVLLYPLDLVKVRLAVNEDTATVKTNALTRKQMPRRTIWNTLRGVMRHEGVLGLYQGMTPALVGSAVSWGGYFFLYDRMKQELMHRKQTASSSNTHHTNTNNTRIQLGSGETFAASCLSGATLVFLTNPIWLIKTRMQLQLKKVQQQQKLAIKASSAIIKDPYKNMWHAARTIVKEEGPMALYKGTIPALMLVSNGGVQMVIYEFLKGRFGDTNNNNNNKKKKLQVVATNDNPSILHRFQDSLGYLAMGAASKMIATTVTYPIQLIKSRLQQRSQVMELTLSGEVEVLERHYSGVVDCIQKILKREGPSGFFKGCIPNALRVAPNAAITFMVYETVIGIL